MESASTIMMVVIVADLNLNEIIYHFGCHLIRETRKINMEVCLLSHGVFYKCFLHVKVTAKA
jgi:hypothetical protein